MPRIPQLTSKQVERLLIKNGFIFKRQRGSHKIFIRGNNAIVVLVRRKPLKKGTLSVILKQAGLR